MNIGTLQGADPKEKKEWLAVPTASAIESLSFTDEELSVVEINPELSDTASFCAEYKVEPNQAANCVIIEASRGDKVWHLACVILASTRADVNGLVRKHIDARKASFAPMDKAVSLTSMEYGAITPIGLPADWPILIDKAVAESPCVIIGSGIRKSKLIVAGSLLARIPNAVVLENLGVVRQ